MDCLNVQNLSKNFGSKVALDDVSLAIPDNSIFGLLGPNGAGKTTMIRIINRIYQGDSGQIFYKNKPVSSLSPGDIGYMPEERGLYPKMKVGEMLLFLTRLKGLSYSEAKKSILDWLEKFEATDWWNMKVEQLSKGMQQKIQFIATVAHGPDLLILDEPFSGFDPVNAEMLKREIFRLREEKGVTIIFSSHRMENVEELCSHVAMINNSKIILNGELSEVQSKFSDNHFKARIKTNDFHFNDLDLDVLEVKEPGAGIFDIKFKTKSESANNANAILRQLMEKGEVESFRNVVPSLHDIFIQLVNKKDHEQHRTGHTA